MSETRGEGFHKFAKGAVRVGVGITAAVGLKVADNAIGPNEISGKIKDAVAEKFPSAVQAVETVEYGLYEKTKDIEPISDISKMATKAGIVIERDVPVIGAKLKKDATQAFETAQSQAEKGRNQGRSEMGLPDVQTEPTVEVKMSEQIKIKALPLVGENRLFQPADEIFAAEVLMRDLNELYPGGASKVHSQLYQLEFPGDMDGGNKKIMMLALIDPPFDSRDGEVRNIGVLNGKKIALQDSFNLHHAQKKLKDDKNVYIFSLETSEDESDPFKGLKLTITSSNNRRVEEFTISNEKGEMLVNVDSTKMAENSEYSQKGLKPLYESFFINKSGVYDKAIATADVSIVSNDAQDVHDRVNKRTLDK